MTTELQTDVRGGCSLQRFVRPPSGYQIVYADPPWPYHDTLGGNAKMGAMPYPTMTMAEICALPVKEISAKDSALLLWATMPKLREAFDVIEAWGYSYRTCAFVWVKQNPREDNIWLIRNDLNIFSGLGRWVNGNAELCLFAKRGRPQRVSKSVKQIVLAPRGRHSAKPPEVRDRIVQLLGDVPRIELFAREKTPGWEAWGNEV